MIKDYGFIVDTNKYSGNFEREMCAYMTGNIGECGVGYEEAEAYNDDGFEPLGEVISKPDEHGCYRPVAIYETPNMWNNGMGFEYTAGQEELALEKFRESTFNYYSKQKEIVRRSISWTEEDRNSTIAEYDSKIAEANALTEPDKYPAYMSVLIYFQEKPNDEVIAFMKQRAEKYVSEYAKSDGIEITGFRLLESVTNNETTSV